MSELIDCIDGLTAEDIIKSIAKTANGLPFYLQTSGGGFCAEFQAVYDAYVPVIPDAIQLAAQNTMVCGLVEDGVWAKLDTFWVMANGDSPNCHLNWINPALYTLTPINAPTFTAWEGYAGDGATEYIDTGYNPTDDGTNYTLNSASFGYYARTVGAGAMMGVHNSRSAVATLNTGNHKVNDITWGDPVPGAPAAGLHIYTRTSAANRDVFINKTKYSSAVASSILPLTGPHFTILAYNNNGVIQLHTAEQCSMAFAGGALTQADADNLTDRFEAYMDSNGKGVIP